MVRGTEQGWMGGMVCVMEGYVGSAERRRGIGGEQIGWWIVLTGTTFALLIIIGLRSERALGKEI